MKYIYVFIVFTFLNNISFSDNINNKENEFIRQKLTSEISLDNKKISTIIINKLKLYHTLSINSSTDDCLIELENKNDKNKARNIFKYQINLKDYFPIEFVVNENYGIQTLRSNKGFFKFIYFSLDNQKVLKEDIIYGNFCRILYISEKKDLIWYYIEKENKFVKNPPDKINAKMVLYDFVNKKIIKENISNDYPNYEVLFGIPDKCLIKRSLNNDYFIIDFYLWELKVDKIEKDKMTNSYIVKNQGEEILLKIYDENIIFETKNNF